MKMYTELEKCHKKEKVLIKDWNTIIPLYSEEMKKLTSGDSQPLKAAALQLTFFEAVSKNKPEILYNEIISYR